MVAVAFNTKANNRLASLGNAVNNALGPAVFNTDHHDSRHVGVAACADQGLEVQIKVRTELQTAIRVGDGHGAFDGSGNRFGCSVGEVIQGQDDDVVANTDATIVTAITPEGGVFINYRHV